jgi:hypothetical protein
VGFGGGEGVFGGRASGGVTATTGVAVGAGSVLTKGMSQAATNKTTTSKTGRHFRALGRVLLVMTTSSWVHLLLLVDDFFDRPIHTKSTGVERDTYVYIITPFCFFGKQDRLQVGFDRSQGRN